MFQRLVLRRQALEFYAFVGRVWLCRDWSVGAIAVASERVCLRVAHRFEVVLVRYLLVLPMVVIVRHLEARTRERHTRMR